MLPNSNSAIRRFETTIPKESPLLIMHPRQGAFLVLRRLALQGLRPATQRAQLSQGTVFRALTYHATAPLSEAKSSSQAFQVPPPPSNTPKRYEPGSRTIPDEYEMTFTCKPCGERSTHRVSKQGYHKGSVLITCPGCRNRHVISDNLKIFGDKALTIEDLMQEQGQLIKKGSLSEDGDLEFWSDGTTTERAKPDAGEEKES